MCIRDRLNGAAGRGSASPANGEGTTDGRAGAATARAGNVNGAHTSAALDLRSAPRDGAGRPGVVTMSPIAAQATPTVWPLVNAYRSRGHYNAKLDPLGLLETTRIVGLAPATWRFPARNADRVSEPTGVHGIARATLGEI